PQRPVPRSYEVPHVLESVADTSHMRATLTSLSDGWLDPERAPHQQMVRHRFIVAAAGLMSTLLTVRSIAHAFHESWAWAASVLVFAVIYALLVVFLRLTAKSTATANGMMCTSLALVALLVFQGSHLFTNITTYLVLLPLTATLMLGARAGLLWCGAALGIIAALLCMHGLGWTADDHSWMDAVQRSMDVGVAVLMATGLALTFDVAQQAALKQQDENAAALVIENQVRRAAEHAARQAESSARSAMQARTRFLASMSHELRTPLHGVIGATSLIDGAVLPDDQRQLLHTAQTSADLLLSLINDVLDYARLDAAAVHLERVPFDLRATLEDVANPMALQGQEKGVSIVVDVEPDLHLWREGDPTRLRQILLNLTGNAMKFTSEGSVTLRAKSSPHGVLLEVIDTGIGMDADALDRIFQPFEQAEGSTARRFGGTGLGLAIVRRLVDVHGGTLDVRSEPGRGTTFAVTLPLPATEAAAPDPIEWVQTRQLRVLVVDDNAVNRTLAMHMLRREGHVPVEVNGGLDAIAAIEQQPFDAILMDCQMPELDGLETTRRIRAHGHPVVILGLSASAQPEDKALALASGMDAYITKPITPQALARAISHEANRVAQAA
ncbi:MAG: ATP-binding protein, partial [Myxococcota bacterium]